MKWLTFSALLMLTILGASAQQDISLSFGSGISKMQIFDPTNELFGLINVKTYTRRTVNIGAQYTYRFNQFSIETGVSYNLMGGSQSEKFQITDAETGEIFNNEGITILKAHYLSVPLLFNYTFRDFSVGAGVSVGYLITDSYSNLVLENETPSLVWAGGNQLAKFDFGLNTQLGYAITDKLTVQTQGYLGHADISNGTETGIRHKVYGIDPKIRELKNRQLTIGFKYYIRPKVDLPEMELE